MSTFLAWLDLVPIGQACFSVDNITTPAVILRTNEFMAHSLRWEVIPEHNFLPYFNAVVFICEASVWNNTKFHIFEIPVLAGYGL